MTRSLPKHRRPSRKTDAGAGCTEGARVAEVSERLRGLTGFPTLLAGSSRGQLVIGLTAAEKLMTLARDGATYQRLVEESERKTWVEGADHA